MTIQEKTILGLLAKQNFITFNKTLAKKIGIDETILFGELCSKYYFANDNEFTCEYDVLIEDTCLTEYRLRNALKNLQNYNLVIVEKKGLPAKNHYKLNASVLIELLQDDVECQRTSGVKFDTTRDNKNNSTCDSNFDTTKYIYNNNKNLDKNNKENYTNNSIVKEKRFAKPTLEDVIAYCEEKRNGVDPEKWFNYYESNGWKVGKNSMKNWKACVNTWARQNFGNNNATSNETTDKGFKKYSEDEIVGLI